MNWDSTNTRANALLRRRLLAWFDRHQRDLPWRKNKTAYRIWVSEIMLQQTQVATVIDYYLRFVKRFPTVKKLAADDESEVLKLWEGLGYYRRARQLHAAAKVVVEQHRGVFPERYEDVIALPGIGRYTAGAILSISGDQKLPILEGNTIRLFARLLGMKSDPRTTENQRVLWQFAESILPSKRCGDFNQSLMEVGNQICKPQQPLCDACPLMSLCPTFANGWQKMIPAKSKKVVYQQVREAVVLVSKTSGKDRRWLIRICGPQQRWAGLWDFPRFSMDQHDLGDIGGKKKERTGSITLQRQRGAQNVEGRSVDGRSVEERLAEKLKTEMGLAATLIPIGIPIKHAVTRFRIELHCFEATAVKGRLKKQATETQWATAEQLQSLPMSVTGRKIAGRLKELPLFADNAS